MAEDKKPTQKRVFDHGGKAVFVFVPSDETDRRKCLEHLEEPFSFFEDGKQPRVVTDLKIGRLPSDAVVYVCHPYDARERNPASQKFELVHGVHVSEPLELGKFSTSIDGDGLGNINVPAITDTLQLMCRNYRSGKCFSVRLSAEKDWQLKSAKLFNA
jgi:hypothetical protein